MLTAASKRALSTAVRALRGRLLKDLRAEAERGAGLGPGATLDERAEHAAFSLVHRVVVAHIAEATGLVPPAAGSVRDDRVARVQRTFDALRADLPGFFEGPEAPASALRTAVEALDDEALAQAWLDDTALGWVFQFWNDPTREAIDARLSRKGRVEAHELACKTQLFTERYMVEWTLANTVGRLWLAICAKNGWASAAHAELEALRSWRSRGARPVDAPVCASRGLWRYYVDRPLSEGEVREARSSLRELRLLDPACGTGHFLVLAFDLLVALYREEASHRGETWPDAYVIEHVVGANLHGVDIDPRAVRVAAASLYLKARRLDPRAKLPAIALVATTFELGYAAALHDPARALGDAAEVPPESLARALTLLAGAPQRGSLLRVDAALRDALAPGADTSVLALRLEAYLSAHTPSTDLGVRVEGDARSAGARFVRIARDGAFDAVVGNPPYLSSAKMVDPSYLRAAYPEGQADLFAAFFLRGLELARPGGYVGLVTLSNWLFLSSFEALRSRLLQSELVALADLGKRAFLHASALINTSITVLRRAPSTPEAVAVRAVAIDDEESSSAELVTERIAGSLVAASERYVFDPSALDAIEGRPVLYFLGRAFLLRYGRTPKVGERVETRGGMATYDNERFLRAPWEVTPGAWERGPEDPDRAYVPYIKGARGRAWFDSLSALVRARDNALELRVALEARTGSSQRWEEPSGLGVAYTTIGNVFAARMQRTPGVLDVSGASLYPREGEAAAVLCALNRTETRRFLEALNPTVNFQLSDVVRAPLTPVAGADTIVATLRCAFAESEAARETSVEFRAVGPSPWRAAQAWAQRNVDRPEGEALASYAPAYEPASLDAELTYALGVALGRFGAKGEGWLREAPAEALPAGLLFLSAAGDGDGLEHPAAAPLREAWARASVEKTQVESLRGWLQRRLFEAHREAYDNRPIFWPLSSEKRSFVAWASVHRWRDDTLGVLVRDHLVPAHRALEAKIAELRRTKRASDTEVTEARRLLAELVEFTATVRACAERGPGAADARCPKRERDAPYAMLLDDGVAVNAAALWPLLDPQWRDPKKWWSALASGEGRRNLDWSRTAARYFPARVEGRCARDPSLAVAHGRLWALHPAVAYAWELRLSEERGAPHRIDEADAASMRARFVSENAAEIEAIEARERRRQARKVAASTKP